MLARVTGLISEYRLAAAILVIGLAAAIAVGVWASSVTAAAYTGAILGVLAGMVIAYTNARHEAERREGRRR